MLYNNRSIQSTSGFALNATETSFIEVLLYFGIFNYPLKADEVVLFSSLPLKLTSDEAAEILDKLVEAGMVYANGVYYSLSDDKSQLKRRLDGNKKAASYQIKAGRYGRIIQSFPFVRSVCVSGSLSKGFVDEKGDIDYFIITKPQRLWVARTLLIAFKKIFLFNSHRYFCVNYFVDTNHLEIPDKNIFTATELLTLLPVTGSEHFEHLLEANPWALPFLPNIKVRHDNASRSNSGPVKRFFEFILNNSLGDRIDTFFMKLTIKRWRAKFSYLSAMDFENALRSRKYVSKHHPQNFQKRVLQQLEKERQLFEEKFNVLLNG